MFLSGLYGASVAQKFYTAEDPYRLAPHVYQAAAAAVQKLGESGTPQSSIITGESGEQESMCSRIYA